MSTPIRIMISSTRFDLMLYREVSSKVIEKLRKENQGRQEVIEVSMEVEVQTGRREYPVAISKEWVEKSDWVVVIVGWYYGTVTEEDDALGLGVTEWEYRHALGLDKRIFVFVGGARGTPNAFSPSSRETNLPNFLEENSDEALLKLKVFRRDIGTQHAAFFKDVDHFEEQLESTLRQAIRDLPLDVEPGSGLADLILAVEPAIENCWDSVLLLERYKRITALVVCTGLCGTR